MVERPARIGGSQAHPGLYLLHRREADGFHLPGGGAFTIHTTKVLDDRVGGHIPAHTGCKWLDHIALTVQDRIDDGRLHLDAVIGNGGC